MKNYQQLFTFHFFQVIAFIYFYFENNFIESIRNNTILNIVSEESIIFNTKDRVPFAICVEIFRPEELLFFYFIIYTKNLCYSYFKFKNKKKKKLSLFEITLIMFF